MRADIRLDHRMIAVDHDERLHVMLELEARATGASGGEPAALALVLDRSGSMSGDKLEAARSCALWLAERLRADATLAVVAFDAEVGVVAPAGLPRQQVARALRALRAGSTTNLSGGWMRGVELVRDARGPRRVILLTDGLANVGVTDATRLVSLARAAAEHGVVTTTIGFGDGFDEDLLTAMADAGRGSAHFAASPESAASVFEEEADELAALAAQNVSVEIRPAAEVAAVSVLGDYPVSAGGGAVRVELGDAYGGHRRRLVVALDIPGLPALGPRVVGEIILRYTDVTAGVAQHRLTFPVTVNVATPQDAEAAGIDQDVREEVAILQAAEAQRRAAEDADRGDFGGARARLHAAADALRSMSADSARSAELAGHVADLVASAEAAAQDAWSAAERKNLHYRSQRAARGKPRRDHF